MISKVSIEKERKWIKTVKACFAFILLYQHS